MATLALLLALGATLWVAGKAAVAGWEAITDWTKKLDTQGAKAIRVIDGDSLLVQTENSKEPLVVRIRGIDSPEFDQVGGKGAKELLTALVDGRELEISNLGTDKFGRTLADISYKDENLGEELVQRGAAWAAPYAPDTKMEKAEEQARKEKRGIWKAPGQRKEPWKHRQEKEDGINPKPKIHKREEMTLDDFR